MVGWRPTRIPAVVCIAAMWALAGPATSTGVAAHDPPTRVYLGDMLERAAVDRAVRGAATRLERASCEAVLDDFIDASGQSLRAALVASRRTAAKYLIERVWFVDGGDEPQCRHTEAAVAFTAAGDDLIRVCAAKFTRRFARQKADGELLIIHELLHALGLGEDPPTSAAITARVRKRCSLVQR
jgi:hypothetical protein